ncbi:Non-catalytic module family DOC2, partial [Piromyces sp. E2]
CWSEAIGYKCCSSGCNAVVVYTDNDGSWGVENGQWCGITCNHDNDECPNKKLGYPCCNSCDVYLVENNEKWGVQDGQWCSIKNSC